jgi:hypothetical protein
MSCARLKVRLRGRNEQETTHLRPMPLSQIQPPRRSQFRAFSSMRSGQNTLARLPGVPRQSTCLCASSSSIPSVQSIPASTTVGRWWGYLMGFACFVGDSPPERSSTPTDSTQRSSAFGLRDKYFRVIATSWRRSGEQLLWAGFGVRMDELQPARVLDGSVDLASHDVAWEFCAGLGEVDNGGGELALDDRPFHSDLWEGTVNTRIGGTKVRRTSISGAVVRRINPSVCCSTSSDLSSRRPYKLRYAGTGSKIIGPIYLRGNDGRLHYATHRSDDRLKVILG